jgi:uncharacterized protein
VRALARRLELIATSLGAAQEDAFSAGQAQLVQELDQVLTATHELLTQLRAGDAQATGERTRHFEAALFAGLGALVKQVQQWLSAGGVSETDLDPQVLAHFKSSAGHYVAYVSARESIWDVTALDRFVAALKASAAQVTGFPVTHQVYSRMVVRGFAQAMVYAFIAVMLLLYLDFRQVKATLLAVVPLGFGFLLLQLVLWLLGIEHNYASIAAFPVLLGYGVAYGVNIVHRWLENPRTTAFVSAYTIGKGVVLSSAAALAGVGSIIFARHGGVAAFGVVLFAGILLCLVLAALVLPAVIDLLYVRKGDHHGS